MFQDAIEPILMGGLIREAVEADGQKRLEDRNKRSELRDDVLHKVYGGDIHQKFTISPSTASMCIRRAIYESSPITSEVKPIPPTFEQNMNMASGAAIHADILRKLSPFGQCELSVKKVYPRISARIDFFYNNPVTERCQVMDLKVVGDYSFNSIERAGLPDELKVNKKVYRVKPEAELQVLTYMMIMKDRGYDIDTGNIIYLSRSGWEIKEGVVPYNAVTEEKANNFFDLIRDAQRLADEGELPPPSVAKGNEYFCKSMCPFRHVCEPGRAIAGGKIQLKDAIRPSRQARYLAKKSAEERKRKLIESGHLQGNFFDKLDID